VILLGGIWQLSARGLMLLLLLALLELLAVSFTESPPHGDGHRAVCRSCPANPTHSG